MHWQMLVTFCHLLGSRRCHWLVKAQHANGLTDKPCLRTMWSNQMVVLLIMVVTMTSSVSEGAWTMQCAGSLCASGATHVRFATHALSKIQDPVVRQWCRLWCGCDDATEAAENNSEEEAVAPRKSDPKRPLARAQAKLVCAAKAGTLRHGTRARICDCLGAMGVKVPYNMNRQQARDIAMQQALPLLAQMDSDWVPLTDRVTRSAAPPSSSQACSPAPVDDMDGLIDE